MANLTSCFRTIADPECLLRVLGAYYLGLVVVVLGVCFGEQAISRREHDHQNAPGIVTDMCAWDGVWYGRIAADGYSYDPDRHSTVAYFPGYPLLVRTVAFTLNLKTETAQLVVSHLSFLFSLIAFQFYLRGTVAEEYSVVLLAIWPMGLFLRMGYGESLFLLLCLLTLLTIRSQGPCWLAAILAGAATGTRSVGVALILPLAWDWWQRSRSWQGFVGRAATWGPVACWGLLAYMAYQYEAFGDPLAFVKTQRHWSQRPGLDELENLMALCTLEPIWTIYLPSSPAYWRQHEYIPDAAFSLQFWNPVYFVVCGGLVGYGAWKKLLTPPEWLVSVGLLGIPFVMQSYRMMMLGHGRFTCVVFPMFIVLGHLVAKKFRLLAVFLCIVMGVQLFYWSALFAAWHRVF